MLFSVSPKTGGQGGVSTARRRGHHREDGEGSALERAPEGGRGAVSTEERTPQGGGEGSALRREHHSEDEEGSALPGQENTTVRMVVGWPGAWTVRIMVDDSPAQL